MKIEIKNRWNSLIYSGDHASLAEALSIAIKGGADLRSADLRSAYLSGAYLRSADLRSADLRSAYLRSANLRSADLSGANLSGAYLRSADLSGADLSGANLSSADLRSANLSGAYLRSADLSSADLSGADLSSADLRSADLRSADLSGANLRSADLSGANLSGANLRSADGSELAISRTRILPQGELIVWKKAACGAIVELLIPKTAKRSHAFGRKCRASKAKVLSISTGEKEVFSNWDRTFSYKVGRIIKPKLPFDDNWMNECGSGIHFFITREEAEAYTL